VGEYAIETENLSRTFGGQCAVDRISLTVRAGTVFGLLGPKGSGKTTVIRLLLGLLEPTAGAGSVLGLDIRTQGDRIRENTGALLAHSGLYDRLTAVENLDFYGRIWHMPAADRRARTKELLNSLNLWDLRDQMVGEWDKGARRKLSLARAVFHRPALVFIDEPTNRLDPTSAAAIWSDLENLSYREGITVFLATRHLHEAEAICSAVAVMRTGKVLAVGPLPELRARTCSPTLEVHGRGFTEPVISLLSRRPEIASVRFVDNRLFLELTGNHDTAPLVTLLVEASADVEEVHKHHAGLQTVFDALLEEDRGTP
jgi:ABC-2 type transport system ATP-binding protein